MDNSQYDMMLEKILESLNNFYKGKPYDYILFAFECDNPNGFAFTSARGFEVEGIANTMRRFADKIEKGIAMPIGSETEQ